MSQELLEADIARVYTEYNEARAVWEASDKEAPDHVFAKLRWDRAQQALFDTRKLWREIGEAAGVRGYFVKAEDNSPPPPDLIGVHIQGAGEAGTPAALVDNDAQEG